MRASTATTTGTTTVNAVTTTERHRPTTGWGGKALALVLILLCLALGLAGLILPIIPGLLFLALAFALLARHSPRARRHMRRHRRVRRALDRADGFLDADHSTKAKLSALYAARAVTDTVEVAARGIRSGARRVGETIARTRADGTRR